MAETTVTCPLCGYRFDPTRMACHTSCPLSAGCYLLCCPNCGYQVPDERRMGLTLALRRLWSSRRLAKRPEARHP